VRGGVRGGVLGGVRGVTSSEVWDEETAAHYDEDSAEQFAPEVLGPAVDLLERLADGGPALELAVGTGRVALPLVQRGVPVVGVELSEPMVGRLRRKAGARQLPVVVGDMATAVAPGAGSFSLVFLVWNSLSNLRTQDEQVSCFQNAARHLRPGGRFVVELWVPPLRSMAPRHDVVPVALEEDHLVFDSYDVATQECVSHHYRRDGDGSVRHEAGRFRYAWPSECDLMARLAGLALESRWADWRGTPFSADSESHVSVWRKSELPVRRRADVTTTERVGGVKKRRLFLADHDPGWAREYAAHEARVRQALGGTAVQVEHIGSTSVPGLAAKPIIDILLTVPDITAEEDYLEPLVAHGYVLRVREPGHRLVRTEQRDVHIHILERHDPAAADYVLLRDHLRVDQADRELYERTKRELLRRDWADMNDYADAKTAVIEEIKQRARSTRNRR
jgi:GrpB-like predicted nucleotidyltransferase (UPF0157 family)